MSNVLTNISTISEVGEIGSKEDAIYKIGSLIDSNIDNLDPKTKSRLIDSFLVDSSSKKYSYECEVALVLWYNNETEAYKGSGFKDFRDYLENVSVNHRLFETPVSAYRYIRAVEFVFEHAKQLQTETATREKIAPIQLLLKHGPNKINQLASARVVDTDIELEAWLLNLETMSYKDFTKELAYIKELKNHSPKNADKLVMDTKEAKNDSLNVLEDPDLESEIDDAIIEQEIGSFSQYPDLDIRIFTNDDGTKTLTISEDSDNLYRITAASIKIHELGSSEEDETRTGQVKSNIRMVKAAYENVMKTNRSSLD